MISLQTRIKNWKCLSSIQKLHNEPRSSTLQDIVANDVNVGDKTYPLHRDFLRLLASKNFYPLTAKKFKKAGSQMSLVSAL